MLHTSRRRTHVAVSAMARPTPIAARRPVAAVGSSRSNTTGTTPTQLITTGSSVLRTVVKPANSGGMNEIVGVALGAPSTSWWRPTADGGASLTVATTGPSAPPQSTGTAMANAATTCFGSRIDAVVALTSPVTTSRIAGATRWLA